MVVPEQSFLLILPATLERALDRGHPRTGEQERATWGRRPSLPKGT
ncbi:MAG: hypothetical protein WCH44_10750 [Betaproteobacteria bacterium]